MNDDIQLSDSTLERLPPQSLEAEQAVLGALLVSGDGVSRIVDLLDPEYFYRKAHQVIYAAMLDLYEENEPIDIVTVSQYLKDEGKLENVGGRQYITDLSLSVATTANLEYYAKLVQEKAILRQLIKAGTEIVGSCYEETDADMALDRAEHMIFTLAQKREMQQLVHIKHIVEDSFQKIEQRYENRESLSGVPSGFYDLDALTSGFQPSDLVIIAARPSMGKCLAADSEIVLSDGSVATIEQIYRARHAELLTLGHNYKFRFTRPSLYIDDGIKPVYRVTTKLGRSIETTLKHPFLTLSGWQKLEKLNVGNKIALPKRIPIFGDGRMSEFDVKLMALLTSEGCVPDGAVRFGQVKKPVLASLVRKPGTEYGAQTSVREAPFIPDNRIKSIAVPSLVFTLERRLVAIYLNMLFSAHGWINNFIDGSKSVSFATVSKRLAQQIQHLLLRFGIVARLREAKTNDGIHSVLVEIYDAESVEQFENSVHQYVEEEVQLSDRNSIETDLYWDEIESIESAGMKQVYDLSIPQTHNFVANDICVHNTAFVLNIAQQTAVEHNIPVAIFSLEMSKESLVMRMLCSEAEIDANRLRTGHMHTTDWTKLASAMGRLGEAPIFIDDSALVNALEIRAKCRRLKAEMNGLGLVIIDYIQLMQGRKATDNRVQEVSEISRSLKQLAREINVPVLALSQLSRAVEARQNKRPMLSDLRESGCLAGDAMIFLPDTDECVRIDSLEGRAGFNVLAMNQQTLKLEPRVVTNAFCTGVKPVFKIVTDSNRTICATGNHRFMTMDGWMRLDQLTVGEKLAVPERTTIDTAARKEHEINAIIVAQTLVVNRLDISWDQIVSIEPAGETAVYDLTVDEHHNFIANDIVVHNSIEQDADLVMFIYRDEYYNQESDKRGEAEIIIAKQRNGPTGTVDLLYQGSITRFLNKVHSQYTQV